MSTPKHKVIFGDFQTPFLLAEKVCRLLREKGEMPHTIVEPSCGEGHFVEAAIHSFGEKPCYAGFDINPNYIENTRQRLSPMLNEGILSLYVQDFFCFDWKAFLKNREEPLLFLGNPPWVTNAGLGLLEGTNLPQKSNLKGLSGLEARTGKANFDISEWMMLHLIEAARGHTYTVAMLCKTGVARRVLEYCWKHRFPLAQSALYRINAQEWFGVSVDACLLYAHFQPQGVVQATTPVYTHLESPKPLCHFGLVEGSMVANVENYLKLKHLCGNNYYRWRSGIKHDLAKVMELTLHEDRLYNGLGEIVEIEEAHLYPLLKATDIAKGNTTPSRYVIVTQQRVGEDTLPLRDTAPQTWDYLTKHATRFAERKSSIYKNQPSYCLFGIGSYSFAPYKLAISALHKEAHFTKVGLYKGKPVLLDDTCYSIGSTDEQEIEILASLFQSGLVRQLLEAISFPDSKRPITAELLNRIDIRRVAEELGLEVCLNNYLQKGGIESQGQGRLLLI